MDTECLKAWFIDKKRLFPWREELSPYSVWVSEVMLQQTQASVVIPYFLKWMARFPTIETLAEAQPDEVIKLWEGLGYYSRARSLHEGAKYVMAHFGGELPANKESLSQIKGLGPYTVGAILSFAFHQRTPAVDGNVMRVLARFFKVEEEITKTATIRRIWEVAGSILPADEPWIINEALIELGATLCQRSPKCTECPIRAGCLSHAHGVQHQLPVNTKKIKIERLFRAVAVISCENHYLIKRGQKGEIMSDLHEFPFFEVEKSGISGKILQNLVSAHLDMDATLVGELEELSHSYTRYRVELKPYLLSSRALTPIPDLEWKTVQQLQQLAFSSGHRRIFESLQELLHGSMQHIQLTC